MEQCYNPVPIMSKDQIHSVDPINNDNLSRLKKNEYVSIFGTVQYCLGKNVESYSLNFFSSSVI